MNASAIPFAADDAHRFLPWLIGIMVGLVTLLLCLALTINGWILDRHGSYSNTFTVNIPASSDDIAPSVAKIEDTLKALPSAVMVTRINDSKLRTMLAPWFGSSDMVKELPLPTMYEVTLDEGATPPDYKALQRTVNGLVPGTEVDTHEHWLTAFASFSAALQWLIGFLSGLIICAMALTIAFTSRASLKLHNSTVLLLYSIGAEDRYIARLFQNEVFQLALRGAVCGCLAAGVFYWIGGMYMSSLQSPQLPALSFTLKHVALLFLMPLICGGIALLSARVSVIRQLHRLL